MSLSPFLSLGSYSQRQIGIVAEDMLPYFSIVTITLSIGTSVYSDTVRYDPRNIIVGQMVALHHLTAHASHVEDRILKDMLPLLIDEVLTACDRLCRGGTSRSARLHDQVRAAIAVGLEESILYA